MTKILLVEDDKSLREIYGVRLLAEGYDIVSAGDGEEALAMAIKERPALILSDVMMPKISGFDMLDILRSATETKDIKVIIMTALSSEDQRARGEQLGADRYLVKSQVGIEDVVRTVHEVLGDVPGLTPAPQPQPAAQPAAPQPAPAMPQSPQMPPVRPDVSALSPQPTLQAAAPAPATLPQPTAPFSSSAPRPANLGERVIRPLEGASLTPTEDVAKLMEQELEGIPNLKPQPAEPEHTPEETIPTLTAAPSPAPETPAEPTHIPVTTPTPQAPQSLQSAATPEQPVPTIPAAPVANPALQPPANAAPTHIPPAPVLHPLPSQPPQPPQTPPPAQPQA
ncbi:response regulator transcription factor [Candidatus Nanosynbacter featherlites]|uniref:Response regulator n=1 Tax=Candidatus Nanosynbacter featherlites TaxID=2572088 RepID=A0A4P9A2Z4_9BACT|nr:response regulator [Candidatus Nanosynbacter featherlites]QCT42164.1 response regulator [Candidatus Nanosynbacter featherlites]